MASFFFDSSAVVKRYVLEPGTAWVQGLTAQPSGNYFYLAEITGVEVVAALVNHVPPLSSLDLSHALANFQQDYQQLFQLMVIDAALIQAAMNLVQKHRLRAYDAVQLAAGMDVHATVAQGGGSATFISADLKLNAAAQLEGLAVDDPNAHP